MYKLASVLVHLGGSANSGEIIYFLWPYAHIISILSAGHYYAFCRAPNGQFHLFDDSHVNQVGLNEVLNQKAYVLFYVRSPDGVQQNKVAPQSVS